MLEKCGRWWYYERASGGSDVLLLKAKNGFVLYNSKLLQFHIHSEVICVLLRVMTFVQGNFLLSHSRADKITCMEVENGFMINIVRAKKLLKFNVKFVKFLMMPIMKRLSLIYQAILYFPEISGILMSLWHDAVVTIVPLNPGCYWLGHSLVGSTNSR